MQAYTIMASLDRKFLFFCYWLASLAEVFTNHRAERCRERKVLLANETRRMRFFVLLSPNREKCLVASSVQPAPAIFVLSSSYWTCSSSWMRFYTYSRASTIIDLQRNRTQSTSMQLWNQLAPNAHSMCIGLTGLHMKCFNAHSKPNWSVMWKGL